MAGSNGHGNGQNGQHKPGGLGGVLDPKSRNVCADLQLIEKFVNFGNADADNLGKLATLCDEIATNGRSERDRIRAAELRAKLLGMSLVAADSMDKRRRLDNGDPTERVLVKVIEGVDASRL